MLTTGVSLGESVEILDFKKNLDINLLESKAHPSFVSRNVNETLIANFVLSYLECILKGRPHKSKQCATVMLLLH